MSCISKSTPLCAVVVLLSCTQTARSDDAEPAGSPSPAAEELQAAEPKGAETGAALQPLQVGEAVVAEDVRATGEVDRAAAEGTLAEIQKRGTITVVSSTGKSEVIELGRSKLADAAEYSVTVEVPSDAAAGKSSKVKLVLTPKAGWKLNQEYPTKLTVTPPAGVTVDKPTQKRQDAETFSEKVGAFGVVFSAATPGTKKFTAKLRFAVCTDSTCDPRTATLAWAVPVK